MKATLSQFLPLVALVALLTGCAFTKETVALNYQRPPLGEPVKEEATIAVQKLKDARGADPYLLAQKGVYGKTSGAFLTSNEVAVTVTEALTDTLTGMGCKVVAEGADLHLGGDLLKFDSSVIVGFWAGSLEGSIQINLKLTNAKTGALLWSDVISGYSKLTGLQVDRAAHRTAAAEQALQDAMQKLAASESFRKVVTHFNASPPVPAVTP